MASDNKNLGGYKGTGKYGVFDSVEYLPPDSQNPYGSARKVPTTKDTTIPQGNLNTGGEISNDAFMQSLQDKLLEQSSIISSSGSTLTDRLNKAISGIQEGAKASAERIESAYGREKAYAEEKAALGIQTHLEGRSGFATQMVAFRDLVNTTDKNLKDLDQRKEELLLANEAEAASQVSQLQIKALEFEQQAQQQVFSNLLGMSNLAISAQAEERLSRAQSFTEKQAINSVALEYGLNPEGKTLEQIVNEASPLATKFKQAELAKLLAETNRANAEAAKAMKGEGVTKYDDLTIKALAGFAFVLSKDPARRTEYENLLGTITKGGDKSLKTFYDEMFTLQLMEDKKLMEEKQAITQNKTKTEPGIFDTLISKIIKEKPAGWQRLPDGTWRKI